MGLAKYEEGYDPYQERHERVAKTIARRKESLGEKQGVRILEDGFGLAPQMWVVNDDEVTTAYMRWTLAGMAFEVAGSSKLHPKDEDDKEYGRALALQRAFTKAADAMNEWLYYADFNEVMWNVEVMIERKKDEINNEKEWA